MIFQNRNRNVNIQEKPKPILNNNATDLNLLKNQHKRLNKYDMFKISLNYSGKCVSCGNH